MEMDFPQNRHEHATELWKEQPAEVLHWLLSIDHFRPWPSGQNSEKPDIWNQWLNFGKSILRRNFSTWNVHFIGNDQLFPNRDQQA